MHFFSYDMLYHYFKVSKIRQKFKNSPIVKKSTGQVADIIHDATREFENYPRITVGEDAFFSYYTCACVFFQNEMRLDEISCNFRTRLVETFCVQPHFMLYNKMRLDATSD